MLRQQLFAVESMSSSLAFWVLDIPPTSLPCLNPGCKRISKAEEQVWSLFGFLLA